MSEMPQASKIDGSPFYPLAGVSTTAATPSTKAIENIRKNIQLKLPRLHQLPEFMKIKGKDKSIALVGGGPSLKNHLDELRQFKIIMCCGSPNDYLMENGIIPTYCVICDPDPVGLNYYKKLDTETKYLVATAVDPSMVAHFNGYQTILWHCHSDDYLNKEITGVDKLEDDYQAVGGGCTVGLRCLSMSLMFGYNNIHLFGFDSCLNAEDGDIAPYVYEVSTEKEKDQGVIYPVKAGDGNGPLTKTYYCVGYHLAQAEHFRSFCGNFFEYMIPTFHGKSLLADIYQFQKQEYIKLNPNWDEQVAQPRAIFEVKTRVQ